MEFQGPEESQAEFRAWASESVDAQSHVARASTGKEGAESEDCRGVPDGTALAATGMI